MIKTKIIGQHYVFYTERKDCQLLNKKDGRIYEEAFVPMDKLDHFDLIEVPRDEIKKESIKNEN